MNTVTSRRSIIANISGAFSDGAVLFPLLALLSTHAGFSSTVILLSTGLVYIVSAFVFRVPMAVQPLKSIAIAAVTVGATFQEVRLSGLLLGVVCLGLCFLNVERLSKRVPVTVIHQLQVGLGILLILQGIKAGALWMGWVLGASAFLVLVPGIAGLPILGVVATVGLLYALLFADPSDSAAVAAQSGAGIRPGLVVGLLIPQLVLTLGNSVLATQNVCSRYFGNDSWRVTARRLLVSIGLGNILVASIGGMPFCHGSGGVTAHWRGGSTRAWSTALMGVFLLAFALFQSLSLQFLNKAPTLAYPPLLIAVLLIATGVFHLKLAAPTASSAPGLFKLLAACLTVLLTKNLLWVAGAAVLFEILGASSARILLEEKP